MNNTTNNAALADIDWNNECLSVLPWPSSGTKGIVRPTTKGDFAVIEIQGSNRRLIKRLPTLERARAYNFACAR